MLLLWLARILSVGHFNLAPYPKPRRQAARRSVGAINERKEEMNEVTDILKTCHYCLTNPCGEFHHCPYGGREQIRKSNFLELFAQGLGYQPVDLKETK